MKRPIILLLFSLSSSFFLAQMKNLDSLLLKGKIDEKYISKNGFSSTFSHDELRLNPLRAGLYSAVIPGAGQLYNKAYWKIPVVWAVIGTSIAITMYNEKQYQRYRSAFLAELSGLPHEFYGIQGITAEVLGNVQDRAKRNRDYAIIFSLGFYILNILDAVVDAHLYEIRKDPDLALRPFIFQDDFRKETVTGLNLSFNF